MSTTSSRPTIRNWLRRLVSGQPHQIIGSMNNPYMLRWFVIPKNPFLKVYVHKFLRSDDDRALHDHPWWFISIILRGGYVEIGESPEGRMTALCRSSIFNPLTPFWMQCIVHRPAVYRHRVALRVVNGVEQPCWTLIITGPKRRTWGFWCPEANWHIPKRFVPWTEFDGQGCN